MNATYTRIGNELTKLSFGSTMYYKGGANMSFSIRLTKEERELAESYAKLKGMTLAEAFKDALFEKIEDEYDLAIYEEAYAEYVKSGRKSRPAKELWEELGL